MLDYYLLLFGGTFFAALLDRLGGRGCESKDYQKKILYRLGLFLLIMVFTLFSGLRTTYNDTETYVEGYMLLDAGSSIFDVLFTPYGAFTAIEILLKRHFGLFYQPLIMLFALITNWMYLRYTAKHTVSLAGSVFLYTTGFFLFSMAGIKQTVACCLALYALDAFLEKRRIKATLLFAAALFFHPSALCLIVIPMLTQRAFSVKSLLLSAAIIVAVLNLDSLFPIIAILGKDYSGENLFNSYTINPARVIAELVPVILFFVFRHRINRSSDKLLILACNMRFVAFIFIFLGLFMNPIYLGRMSTYFSILNVATTPEILRIGWEDSQYPRACMFFFYLFEFVYFLFDITAIGVIPINYDLFHHISLFDLL